MSTTAAPLLSTNSPLYVKRLARELNALPDGFYCGVNRYGRARVHKGVLQVRALGCSVWETPGERAAFFGFSDAYGRSVTASRKP